MNGDIRREEQGSKPLQEEQEEPVVSHKSKMRAAAATPPRPTGRSGARDKRSEASPSSCSSSSAWSRRKKRKLPHKYYQLIANDHEKTEAKSLRSIRKERLKLIRYLKPPGYKTRDFEGDPEDPKFPEIRDYGRQIFKALTAFVRTMHEKHLTLNGNIKARMMLWIASSRSIKLRNVFPDDFSKFTTDGGKKDYDVIADLIEKDLLRDFKLPEDMKDWVKLLRANPLKNRYLVRYHVALMAPEDKVDHFLKLYRRLLQEQQKSGGKNKYNAVVRNIPAGDYHVWKTDVGRNKYVEKVFNHKREGKGYRDNPDDLLRLVRNCTQHLMQHSVEANTSKTKFENEDMYCMIESCFSGLFHQFQRAMVKAGL